MNKYNNNNKYQFKKLHIKTIKNKNNNIIFFSYELGASSKMHLYF